MHIPIVLQTFYTFTLWILTAALWGSSSYWPYFRWGNRGPERLSNFPKVFKLNEWQSSYRVCGTITLHAAWRARGVKRTWAWVQVPDGQPLWALVSTFVKQRWHYLCQGFVWRLHKMSKGNCSPGGFGVKGKLTPAFHFFLLFPKSFLPRESLDFQTFFLGLFVTKQCEEFQSKFYFPRGVWLTLSLLIQLRDAESIEETSGVFTYCLRLLKNSSKMYWRLQCLK